MHLPREKFTLYRIASTHARKPDRIQLLFKHKNGDFGAISEQRSNRAKLRRADLLSGESDIGYVFILSRIAFAQAEKPYGTLGLLFTHKNGDFGAISATERSCAAPISKVEVVTIG